MKIMGKTDLFVLIGLILSLILFLTFATQNTSQQNQTILQNQALIKQALKVSTANSELILQNQVEILKLSNLSQYIVGQHFANVNQNNQILSFLRSNFNESFIQMVEEDHKRTMELLEIFRTLNGSSAAP